MQHVAVAGTYGAVRNTFAPNTVDPELGADLVAARARGIARGDVIGRDESLSSPCHRERVARVRKQTHGDFRASSMRTCRRRLGELERGG